MYKGKYLYYFTGAIISNQLGIFATLALDGIFTLVIALVSFTVFENC